MPRNLVHARNANGRVAMGAKYTLFLENDLFFEVFMESGGKANIKGNYQECPDKDNKLLFEIETDQTCLKPVIMGIDRLKRKLNDDN